MSSKKNTATTTTLADKLKELSLMFSSAEADGIGEVVSVIINDTSRSGINGQIEKIRKIAEEEGYSVECCLTYHNDGKIFWHNLKLLKN